MAVRISIGLRNAMLDGGANGGIKGALAGGFINIYSGTQPNTANDAASGTLLGTVSVDANGGGLHFGASADGVISMSATENWKFKGLLSGQSAGWFRFYAATGDAPAVQSNTAPRLDGSCGSAGSGDMRLSNIAITLNAPNTVDIFQFTLPEA